MTRNCKFCQKEFEPTHHRQKYCCDKCKVDANRIRSRESYYKEKPNPKGWHFCDRKDCLYYNDYKVNKKPENRCDYNWLTGLLRDCRKGAECNKYIHSTPAKRKKFRNSVFSKDTEGRNKLIF
jgi:hypothetical protein